VHYAWRPQYINEFLSVSYKPLFLQLQLQLLQTWSIFVSCEQMTSLPSANVTVWRSSVWLRSHQCRAFNICHYALMLRLMHGTCAYRSCLAPAATGATTCTDVLTYCTAWQIITSLSCTFSRLILASLPGLHAAERASTHSQRNSSKMRQTRTDQN